MIYGNHVLLRAYDECDLEPTLKWANDPEIRYYMGTIFPISFHEHKKWFESVSGNPNTRYFSICIKETQQLIGRIGLHHIDWKNRKAEMIIYIGEKQFRGQHLGLDATRALVDYCFNWLNLHRIYLWVLESNARAIAMYEKAGFETEGVARDDVFADGRYHNTVRMSILNKK